MLGPSEPGQPLPPPASSEPRARPGRPELQQLPGTELDPARPGAAWGQVALMTGRGATGKAARPEQEEKRGLRRTRTLSPADDSNFSALRGKRGTPGGRPRADSLRPPLPGENPAGRPVPGGKRGKRGVCPWLQVAALRGAPVSCVSPTPIGDERREIKADPRGRHWGGEGRGGEGKGSPLAAGALPGQRGTGRRCPPRYPRGCCPQGTACPAAGRGEDKYGWVSVPRCVQAPRSRLCGQRSPGRERSRDPRPGSRSAQRPRGRARPVPVPPTRAVARWDSVAFYFSFKRNKLKPRSGAGPAEPRPPGPCRGAAPPLTPFCGGNLEGFSKACFSYFFVVVVVVQLALVIYSMHA